MRAVSIEVRLLHTERGLRCRAPEGVAGRCRYAARVERQDRLADVEEARQSRQGHELAAHGYVHQPLSVGRAWNLDGSRARTAGRPRRT